MVKAFAVSLAIELALSACDNRPADDSAHTIEMARDAAREVARETAAETARSTATESVASQLQDYQQRLAYLEEENRHVLETENYLVNEDARLTANERILYNNIERANR